MENVLFDKAGSTQISIIQLIFPYLFIMLCEFVESLDGTSLKRIARRKTMHWHKYFSINVEWHKCEMKISI